MKIKYYIRGEFFFIITYYNLLYIWPAKLEKEFHHLMSTN